MPDRTVTIAAVIIATLLLAVLALGLMSHGMTPEPGLHNGALRPCPDKPNCVCSEAYAGKQERHDIRAVTIKDGGEDAAWRAMNEAITTSGGSIVAEHDGYLHAEFTSPVFRFVDDLEARLDREAGVIHLRSASRVGRSDLGANRKRVEAILSKLETAR